MKVFLICIISRLALCQDRGSAGASASGSSLDGYSCDPSACQLPSCRCASPNPPIANPPQFLVVTFDDSVQTALMPTANSLFPKNPNGCASHGTWFAQVTDTNPYEVQKWYAAGHEVADHSVTHDAVNHVFGGSYAEVEGMRAWASSYAGVPLGRITGWRFPFRNFTVDALNMLSKMGFTYDSSMAAGNPSEHIWPYTLDHGAVTDCQGTVTVCQAGVDLKAPGMWEVPMYATANGAHLMDPYNAPINPNDVYTLFQTTFDTHYAGNRAPFGVYTHPVWLVPRRPGPNGSSALPDGSAKLAAVQKFIAYAMTKPDVWIVTHAQLIAYMRNPVPASQLASQSYMQCNAPAPPANLCGNSPTVPAACPLAFGTFQSCYGCPATYPTLADPAPKPPKCTPPTTCDSTWWDVDSCTCLCNQATCAYNDTARPVNLDPQSIANLPPGGNY